MKGVFVTATDTGAGKTLVSSGIIHALRGAGLRVAGMKPVASGCEQSSTGLTSDDARQLATASGLGAPMDLVNPYRFLPAVAPHIAAAEAGVRIELDRIETACRELGGIADAVVVEGVGGLRVPLNEQEEVAELVLRLRLPVVLVIGMRLGCLNHALLTAEALAGRAIPVCGWVANHVDPAMAAQDENVQALQERLGAPLIGRIPYLDSADPQTVAGCLALEPLLSAMDLPGR